MALKDFTIHQCFKSCFIPERGTPTKKAIGISITTIALGAIGAFITAIALLTISHQLPPSFSIFSPIGGIGLYGSIAIGSVSGILFIGGVTFAILLAVKSLSKRKKLKEKETEIAPSSPKEFHKRISAQYSHLETKLQPGEVIILEMEGKAIFRQKSKVPVQEPVASEQIGYISLTDSVEEFSQRMRNNGYSIVTEEDLKSSSRAAIFLPRDGLSYETIPTDTYIQDIPFLLNQNECFFVEHFNAETQQTYLLKNSSSEKSSEVITKINFTVKMKEIKSKNFNLVEPQEIVRRRKALQGNV